jgi:hypothetical protein
MLLEFRRGDGGGGMKKSRIVGSESSGIAIPISGSSIAFVMVIKSDGNVSGDVYDMLSIQGGGGRMK